MGNTQFTNNKLIDNISWDMTKNIKTGEIFLKNYITKVHIICPLKGIKKKETKIIINLSNPGLLNIYKLFTEINKVYKKYNTKLDHVFFEGLEFIEEKNKTMIFKINTGS